MKEEGRQERMQKKNFGGRIFININKIKPLFLQNVLSKSCM